MRLPTRTVSGTSSASRQVTFSGTWQAHTTSSVGTDTYTTVSTLEAVWVENTSTTPVTRTVEATGVYNSPIQTYHYSFTNEDEGSPYSFIVPNAILITSVTSNETNTGNVVISGNQVSGVYEDMGTNVDGTIKVYYYSSYPTATDTGTVAGTITNASYSSGTRPSNISNSTNGWYVTWSTTDFDLIGTSVSCRLSINYNATSSTWTASGDWGAVEWGLPDNVVIRDAYSLSSSHDTPNDVYVSGNRVYVTWETDIEPEDPNSQSDIEIEYSYMTTVTDYWYANDSVYLGASNRTYTSFSRLSGTQPTTISRGSSGYVNAYWQTTTEPTSDTVTCTGYANYTYPTTNTYAAVYFNGNLVRYVYFNGERFP